MYLGEYRIDDYVTLVATTHRFSSGAAYAPTSITYRVYEDATDVEIVADTAMTNFDSQTGFYLDRIQCTAAIGYETGKTYTALIKATVDSVAAITAYTWRVLTPPVNVTQVAGTTQTAGDIMADTNDIQARLPAALTANGNMKCSLMEILTTALTETAGQISAAFKQFFDIASPTGTMKAITNVVTTTNLTTNNDKTGYAIANGGIGALSFAAGAVDASAIAADAIASSELAASGAEKIADAVLNRNVAGGSNTGRLVKEALYLLRNKAVIAGGTLTVYQIDDSTSQWTAAVSTTAGNPISTVDPS